MSDRGPTEFEIEVADRANSETANLPGGSKALSTPGLGEGLIDTHAKNLVLEKENVHLKEENAQVKAESVRDELTGLYNRRHLDKVLKEIEASDQPVGMLMIDIDLFKEYNDAYGHSVGDLILRGLGRELNEVTRQERTEENKRDEVARYGGEEFVILLRNGNFNEAALNLEADRIRERIKTHNFWIDNDRKVNITVSMGVAKRQSGERSSDLLKRVDDALYRAKREGRDRVVTANNN